MTALSLGIALMSGVIFSLSSFANGTKEVAASTAAHYTLDRASNGWSGLGWSSNYTTALTNKSVVDTTIAPNITSVWGGYGVATSSSSIAFGGNAASISNLGYTYAIGAYLETETAMASAISSVDVCFAAAISKTEIFAVHLEVASAPFADAGGSSALASAHIVDRATLSSAQFPTWSWVTISFAPTSPLSEWPADSFYRFVVEKKAPTATSGGGCSLISAAFMKEVKALSSLSISGQLQKSAYYAGETFDPSGLIVTANFDNSSSSNVTSVATYSPSPLTPGANVSVAYAYEGVTKAASISGVQVIARVLSSIAVTTYPDKLSYYVGDTIDLSGMVITLYYESGDTAAFGPFASDEEYVGITTDPSRSTPLTLETTPTFAVAYSTKADASGFAIAVEAVPTYIEHYTLYCGGQSGWASTYSTSVTNRVVTDNTVSPEVSVKWGGYGINDYAWPIELGGSSAQTGMTLANLDLTYDGGAYLETESPIAASISSIGVTNNASLSSEVYAVHLEVSSTPFNDAGSANAAAKADKIDMVSIYRSANPFYGATTVSFAPTSLRCWPANSYYHLIVEKASGSTSDGLELTHLIFMEEVTSLSGIAISGTLLKTSYIEGETFNPAGLSVTATFSNHTTQNVTASTLWSPSVLNSSDVSATAHFTYGGVTRTAVYNGINVAGRALVAIAVTEEPYKIDYAVGDTIDLAGMVVTLIYDVGENSTFGPFDSDYEYAGITTSPSRDDVLKLSSSEDYALAYNGLSDASAFTISISVKADYSEYAYYTLDRVSGGMSDLGWSTSYATSISDKAVADATITPNVSLTWGGYGVMTSSSAISFGGNAASLADLDLVNSIGSYLETETAITSSISSFSIYVNSNVSAEVYAVHLEVSRTPFGDEGGSAAIGKHPKVDTISKYNGSTSFYGSETVVFHPTRLGAWPAGSYYRLIVEKSDAGATSAVGLSLVSMAFHAESPINYKKDEAKHFASYFLNVTSVCDGSGTINNITSEKWSDLKDEFSCLTVPGKNAFRSNSENVSDVNRALERYTFITTKYQNLEKFLGEDEGSSAKMADHSQGADASFVVVIAVALAGSLGLLISRVGKYRRDAKSPR